MKVNFNTNHSSISANKSNQNPSFGKLIIEREAAEALKRQYRNLEKPEAKVCFIRTFTEFATRLNNLPLVSYLKTYVQKTAMHSNLKLVVHDSSEGKFFKDKEKAIVSVQKSFGDLNFMKDITTKAEQLQKDNEALIKMLKDTNIEVVGANSNEVVHTAEVPEIKPAVSEETQKLAETLQAKGKIDEEETITNFGKPATDPLDWPC